VFLEGWELEKTKRSQQRLMERISKGCDAEKPAREQSLNRDNHNDFSHGEITVLCENISGQPIRRKF
jgi:hypothetical protein